MQSSNSNNPNVPMRSGQTFKPQGTIAGAILRFSFFAVALTAPFIAEKARLDATAGRHGTELSNFFADPLFALSLLPFVALLFLPVKPLSKCILGAVLTLLALPALILFGLYYGCEQYANCI
jgi:hypothetical protein